MTDDRQRDYLFDGAGEPDPEVEELEKALAPLAHAGAPPKTGRGAIWAGLILAIATFACVFLALAPRQIPSRIAGLFYDDFPGEIGVRGGTRVEYRLAPRADVALTDQVAAELRERGANVVFTRPGSVVVDLIGVRPAEVEAWSRGISAVGELELERVHAGTELMERLSKFALSDPDLERLGISADIDLWDHPSGRTTDPYLVAADRATLERYLGDLPPELAPKPGFRFRYEETPRGWRSYYTEDRAWLTSDEIAEARVVWNEYLARSEVLVELTEEGARRFAELTRQSVGQKIAILLDGEVRAAPIVQEPITGGRLSISVGSPEPEARGEAEGLASALTHGPLPAPLEAASLDRIEPVIDGAALLAARALFALPLGLLVFGLALAVGRLSAATDPEVFPLRGAERARGHLFRRAGVTLAGLAAPALLSRIPLPGLDQDALGRFGLESGGQLGAFALGLGPILSAFLLVEIAALVVPPWRRLRLSGPGGRLRLDFAVGALAIVLAALQAWLLAEWTATAGDLAGVSLFQTQGLGPRALAALTLVGGALSLGVLAHIVGRHGLGNGYAILLAGGFLQGAWSYGGAFLEAPTAGELASAVAAVAVVAALVAWALRARVRGASPLVSFRLPTCGLVPIAWASALFSLLGILAMAGYEPIGIELLLTPEGTLRPAVFVSVSAILAAVFSYLFSRPRPLSRSLRLIGDGRPAAAPTGAFLRASALSVALILVLVALYLWAWPPGPAAPSLLAVAVLIAVALDLVAEGRARFRNGRLVPVWPLHRVQLADMAVGALTREGIDVHTRAVHFRTLFFFFAPFAPITLMVPADRAKEAQEILASLLASQ